VKEATINSEDAADLDIEDGENVKVMTKRVEIMLKAKVTDAIREKTIFIPVTERGVNYLTNDLLDRESKQADYNHAVAKLSKAPLIIGSSF